MVIVMVETHLFERIPSHIPLTDVAISNIKSTDKLEKHYDGGGLHLGGSPTGENLGVFRTDLMVHNVC